MPSCRKILRYIFSLEGLGIKPGLRRINLLLGLLDNPEKTYPSVIVGGTNGKGSTSATLASVLKEAGLKAGLYTSPHLVRFNERIRVDGREITDGEVVRLASKIKSLLEKNYRSPGDMPSFFEFTTAMAFEHFREKNVDIAILEVGMGGRWDAVNAATPLISVITGVGFDHTGYLGETLGEIAYEKSGIIKERGVAVTGALDWEAIRVIKDEARKRRARLYIMGRDFRVERCGGWKAGEFSYYGDEPLGRFTLGLEGRHQLKNAACALKAIEILRGYGYAISGEAARKGLKKVVWPGRFELVRKDPSVILDCAHNPEGARALKDALEGLPFNSLTLVLGIMADKDISGIFSSLLPLADCVVLTQPVCKRSAGVHLLMEKLGGYAGRVIVRKRVKDALRAALKETPKMGCVCITGSIFTVGEAREYLMAGGEFL